MSTMALCPGTIVGRYEIVKLLGEGAIAQVFHAIDRQLGRPVALKVLLSRAASEEDFRKRFLREARVLAALSHESIVKVYDCCEESGFTLMAMELVSGESLDLRLLRESQPSLEFVIKVARSMLAGLEYIHDQKVIHRDIKPQNVLLGNEGQIKIADFGLVKARDNMQVTTVGARLGTYRYMSPEVMLGEPATPRSDLYAVGVVLYEMLTGALPLATSSDRQFYQRIRNGQYLLPSQIRPGLPAKLDLIIDKALSASPEDRFSSARRFARSLGKVRLPAVEPAPALIQKLDRARTETVVESVGHHPRAGQTVVEQYRPVTVPDLPEDADGGKVRPKRAPRRRSHRRRRRRSVMIWGVVLGLSGTIVVIVLLLAERIVVLPPSSKPDQTILANSPLANSPVKREQLGLTAPSSGPSASASRTLSSARSMADRAQSAAEKGRIVEAMSLVERSVVELLEIPKMTKGQSLQATLGVEGRLDFLRTVDMVDDSAARCRPFHGFLHEVLLEKRPKKKPVAGWLDGRLALLEKLISTECNDAEFWDLVARCSQRAGFLTASSMARYQRLECRIVARRALELISITASDLVTLENSERLFRSITRGSDLIIETFEQPRSWADVWGLLRAALTPPLPIPGPPDSAESPLPSSSSAASPASPVPPDVASLPPESGTTGNPKPWERPTPVLGASISVSPDAPTDPDASVSLDASVGPDASASPDASLSPDPSMAQALAEIDRMDVELPVPRPSSPAPLPRLQKVLKPRLHPQVGPALKELIATAATLSLHEQPTAAESDSLEKALTKVIDIMRLIRVCSREDESIVEFVEAGQPCLYDPLQNINALIERLHPVRDSLQIKARDYYYGLKELGEQSTDDTPLLVLTGQAALLTGLWREAESHFLQALSGRVHLTVGPSSGERFFGTALVGLARAALGRADQQTADKSRLPGLRSLPSSSLDLLRAHVMAQTIFVVPASIRSNWGVDASLEAQIGNLARRARALLSGCGLPVP